MDDNKLKEKIEDIFARKFINFEYKDVGEKGNKANRIYLIKTDDFKCVVKVPADKDSLPGEESLYDIMYDSAIHQFVFNKTGRFGPPRKILASSDSKDNVFDRPYIIQEFIEGVIPKKSQDFSEHMYLILFRDLLKTYKELHTTNSFAKVSAHEFRESGIEVGEGFENYLSKSIEIQKKHKEKNFIFRYIKNDIQLMAPRELQKDILSYMDETQSKLIIKSHNLIHGDVKMSNLLIKDGKAILFDWSRAYYGDIAHDFAYYLISLYTKGITKDIEKHYYKIIEMCNEENIDPEGNLEQRIVFYMNVLLFSIARVFHSNYLYVISKNIIEHNSTIENLTKYNTWAIGRKY